MKYLVHDIGDCDVGDEVEVTLHGTEANVILLDYTNLQKYKSRSKYSYFGGHFKQSPAIIPIPRSDHWYVVVDLGGFVGKVEASVRVKKNH